MMLLGAGGCVKRKRTVGDAVRLDQKDNSRETSEEKSEPGAVENPFKLQMQASLGYCVHKL